MKYLQTAKKYGAKIALGSTAFFTPILANADIATDTATAVTAAKDTGLAVGGNVVAAVAALVVIGLVITMVRKI